MAQTLTAQVVAKATATYTDARGISTPTVNFNKTVTTAITDGTGRDKAQVLADVQTTLTTLGDVTLDLKALDSAFGSAAFTKIKAILVEVVTDTTGYTLKMKAGAADGFSACFSDPSDELVLQADSVLLLTSPRDGYTVDATHKTLLFTNPSGGSITFNLVVIGEGAIS